jgi:Fe-S-cluster containining protein
VFTGDDTERAAQALGMTASAFAERYLESTWLGLVVTVTDQQPCIFLTEQGCRIQDGKPRQCATFPFWDELTNERGELVRIDRPCPGVRRATS